MEEKVKIKLNKSKKKEAELNGIKIDGITITCEVNELMKLENLTKVY